ncbi:hypothetical protein IGB42_04079 [Andreprevotia sp. IGB-42]|nr:hypothetical protein IGB42_04079 [Andreprevotia sp. IGB-42]
MHTPIKILLNNSILLGCWLGAIGGASAATPETPPDAEQILALTRQAVNVPAFEKLDGYALRGSSTVSFKGHSSKADSFEMKVNTREGYFVRQTNGNEITIRQGTDYDQLWTLINGGMQQYPNEYGQGGKILRLVYSMTPLKDNPATMYFSWVRSEPCGPTLCDVLKFEPSGLPRYELAFRRDNHLIWQFSILDKQDKAVYSENYLAWKALAGAQLPAKFTIHFPDGEMTADTVPYDAGKLAVSEFAPPDAGIGIWRFADGVNKVELPFMLKNNRIYIQTKIDGKGPYSLMVDTGATATFDKGKKDELALKEHSSLEIRGAGEDGEQAGLTNIGTIDLDRLRLNYWPARVVDNAALCLGVKLAAPCIGSVGGDLLNRFAIDFDFDRKLMTVYRPGTPIQSAHKTHLKASLYGDHFAMVEGKVEGAPARFLLDTGSQDNLALNTPYVENQHLMQKLRTTPEGVVGWGYGGVLRGRRANLGSIAMADFELKDKGTALVQTSQGFQASSEFDGVLGLGALKRFNITLDIPGGLIYLEQNSLLHEPDEYFVTDRQFR